MNLKNYTSEVDASKSMANIERVLVEIGASNINKNYVDKVCTGLTFLFFDRTMKQTLAFHLKAQVEECFNIFWKERTRQTKEAKEICMTKMQKPTMEEFTYNGILMEPHYSNALHAWEKLNEMVEVPDELLQAVKSTIQILHEALERDEHPEQQIAFRKMAGIGTFDSTEGGSFQIIVELCLYEEWFIEDGVIQIITDPVYKPEGPYKEMPAQQVLDEKDLIIAGLEEGAQNWKAEYDNCREILKELVILKVIKDTIGKTENYLNRKSLAWQKAGKFLEKYQHQ